MFVIVCVCFTFIRTKLEVKEWTGVRRGKSWLRWTRRPVEPISEPSSLACVSVLYSTEWINSNFPLQRICAGYAELYQE